MSVTVQPGSPSGQLPATVAPERDPRDVVADIVQLNNLDGGKVMPGQQIFVPSKSDQAPSCRLAAGPPGGRHSFSGPATLT